MKMNGDILREHADRAGIPLRTLDQVRDTLQRDKARSRKGARIDVTMARLMLKAGRMTDEARAWIVANYPQD